MTNTEKTFIVSNFKFYHSFTFSNASEKQKFNAFCEKYEVVVHGVHHVGLYGNKEVHWSSDALTGGQIVVGSGYQSLHGSHNYIFSSNDKPLEKESK